MNMNLICLVLLRNLGGGGKSEERKQPDKSTVKGLERFAAGESTKQLLAPVHCRFPDHSGEENNWLFTSLQNIYRQDRYCHHTVVTRVVSKLSAAVMVLVMLQPSWLFGSGTGGMLEGAGRPGPWCLSGFGRQWASVRGREVSRHPMGTKCSSPRSSLCPEEEMEEQELLTEVAAWVGGRAAACLNWDGKGAKSRQ